MSSLRKFKATMKHALRKRQDKILTNMSKDVKQPDPKDIEAAKAIKDTVVKTNQIVKK